MKHLVRALLAALCLGPLGVSFCAAEAQPQDATASADARWSGFVDRFLEAHFAANPTFAVASGRHQYDGQLPDYSPAALQAEIARLQRARSEIAAFDGAQLGESARFERDYLAAVIDEQLFWRAEAQWPQRNPAYYLDDLDPEPYLNKPYAPLAERMRAYIAYARAIPRVAAQIRANLRTPMPGPWIEYGANAFNGFADFYANDVAAIYTAVALMWLIPDRRIEKHLHELT